jgi:Putative Flp pilus-assembly TadE/G-like
MSALRREHGQALALTVVFMAGLLAMTAFVLDVGSWYRADRDAQLAADAAALAGAQALPYDPGQATSLALSYASKNRGGLEPGGISFPPGKFRPNDTIKVALSRSAPGFFARTLGIDSVTVGATASARAAGISQAKWVAPIVVNEKHPKLAGGGCPCFGEDTELEYYHLKEKEPQNDGAGSFGFINLIPGGGNPGTSDLGEWIQKGFDAYMPLGSYSARTGNPFSASHVGDSLQSRIGTEILFPVYRKLTGTGSGAKYDIIGWVGFHLTGIDVHGSNERLFGYFTRVIWEGLQSETGSEPDFGVRSIELVD